MHLKGDREVVLIAIAFDEWARCVGMGGYALTYASDELQEDRDAILEEAKNIRSFGTLLGPKVAR